MNRHERRAIKAGYVPSPERRRKHPKAYAGDASALPQKTGGQHFGPPSRPIPEAEREEMARLVRVIEEARRDKV